LRLHGGAMIVATLALLAALAEILANL